MYKPRPPRPGRGPSDFSSDTYRPIRRPPPSEIYDDSAESPAPYHQERVLRVAGLPAVTALFRRSPDRVLRFFYEDKMVPEVGDFCSMMAKKRRPYRMVDTDELTKIAGTVLHGGVVAVAEPSPIEVLDPAEAKAWAAARQPVVVLDGIGNPHNLGAIARTLAFFGFRHLVLSDHPGQAGLSDAAYRVAEGGLDSLNVYRATNLSGTLRRFKPYYQVVGTALSRAGAPLESLRDDPRPVVLVMGNEEKGLSPETLSACDSVVTIRGSGAVQSLNVSATTAILAYAIKAEAAPRENPEQEARPYQRRPFEARDRKPGGPYRERSEAGEPAPARRNFDKRERRPAGTTFREIPDSEVRPSPRRSFEERDRRPAEERDRRPFDGPQDRPRPSGKGGWKPRSGR